MSSENSPGGDSPETSASSPVRKVLSDSLYDSVKYVIIYVLPALGALYFGLTMIWGWPYGVEVMGSISLLGTFLAVVVGISAANYRKYVGAAGYDGYMPLPPDDERVAKGFVKLKTVDENTWQG